MRGWSRLTVLLLAVLLFAAPTAWAGCEMGETGSPCAMAEMGQSMEMSPCHGAGQMSKDCCEAKSAPEPTQALAFQFSKALAAPPGPAALHATPPAPALPPTGAVPADAFRLHDLGRYTLFSSFLL